MFSLFKNKIFLALTLLVVALLIGVFGYKIIADYSWVDALYMTVITITTVGFGEVTPLTSEAKIFTVLLILSSVFILGFVISVFSEYVISKSSYDDLKHKKMQKKINSFNNHIIVCGYGRNGRQAVQKLMAYKKQFVVIEMDGDLIARYEDDKDILFVQGNANEDEVLELAGITKASTLICALPDDADNLFTVLSARQLNKGLKIISRAAVEASQKKLMLAGADNVVMPDKIGGDHMASLVVVPDLVNFIDNLSVSGEESSTNVQEVSFNKLCPDGEEVTIKKIDLRNRTGCSIIGYISFSGTYTVNPSADLVVRKGSKLIVLGRPEQIKKMHNIL